jgi:hypothetical protein
VVGGGRWYRRQVVMKREKLHILERDCDSHFVINFRDDFLEHKELARLLKLRLNYQDNS